MLNMKLIQNLRKYTRHTIGSTVSLSNIWYTKNGDEHTHSLTVNGQRDQPPLVSAAKAPA